MLTIPDPTRPGPAPATTTRSRRRRRTRWAVLAVVLLAVAVSAAVMLAGLAAATRPSASRGGAAGADRAAGAAGATVATVGAGLLSQTDAADLLERAGIAVSSTDDCDDRDNPRCTSLAGIRPATISMVVDLAATTGCELTVTGGTETGHAAGPYSHGTGYKVDLAKSTCLDEYVTDFFTSIGTRDDGYPQWQSPFGNLYCDEISHWDVTALAGTGTT